MLAALETPMTTPPRTDQDAPREFRCKGCGKYLGRFVNGVLHEDGGRRSGLPVVRRCTLCGKRNVRLK